jgi:hypothetical protein
MNVTTAPFRTDLWDRTGTRAVVTGVLGRQLMNALPDCGDPGPESVARHLSTGRRCRWSGADSVAHCASGHGSIRHVSSSCPGVTCIPDSRTKDIGSPVKPALDERSRLGQKAP